MRNKASFLLLAVFLIFLGIAIFHPFSHDLHQHEDAEHECPICLWLYYAAVSFFIIAVFYVIFRVISFVATSPRILPCRVLIPAYVSRAPPKPGYYSI